MQIHTLSYTCICTYEIESIETQTDTHSTENDQGHGTIYFVARSIHFLLRLTLLPYSANRSVPFFCSMEEDESSIGEFSAKILTLVCQACCVIYLALCSFFAPSTIQPT